MNTIYKYSLLLILIFLPLSQSLAQQKNILNIGIYYGIKDTYPQLSARLKRAAAGVGITLLFTDKLPAQRSLTMAANGSLDGDIIRQPYAVEGLNTLLQVGVPLARFEHWVWVLKDKECPKSEADLSTLKPVGVLGFKYYDFVYRQSKVGFEQVNRFGAMAKMLKLERADYTIGQRSAIAHLKKLTDIKLKTCFKRPLISLNGYLYIHEKHKALIPKLEQAFKPLAEY